MSFWVNILTDVVLISVGAALCYILLWLKDRNSRKVRALQAEALLIKAQTEAEKTVREAQLAGKAEALRIREDTEKSFAARRAERAELEQRLSQREELINSQLQRMVEAEKVLDEQKRLFRQRVEELNTREQELKTAARHAQELLQKVGSLSQEEARDMLLRRVEQEALRDANNLTRRVVDEARLKAEEKARHILSTAIQRYAGEHTFQTTTASIAIHGDDIKGRIIGREGRNIRAFEAATGVTVLIDETPGAVLLSGFDPVRREIARESMLRLIQDGRIHPTRIEEVVIQVAREMEETVVRLGEEAVLRAGLPALAPEIVKLLGRLHFRHSYSQNILDHSVEVSQLMGLLAAELGVDMATAKRAGLLHDIGKAVNHEMEGPHAIVGAEIIKRYGESDAVVNGVASHHNDVPPIGPLGILVSAADAISASRPGARSETMTTYLKRVEDLERIASCFPGVEKAFAVQAGRELRVFVHPEKLDDEEAFSLARKIAANIEDELQYPGQIKIVVIRETRCFEIAK